MNRNINLTINEIGKCHSSVTFYSVYIICPIAKYFSFLFYKFKISPNFITILSSFFAVMGAVLLTLNGNALNPLSLATVFIIWNFSYIFDISDGQVARAIGKSSSFGQWLDHSLDSFNKFIILSSMFFINYNTLPLNLKNIGFIVTLLSIGSVLCLYNAEMCKELIFGRKANPAKLSFDNLSIIKLFRFFLSWTNLGIQFWFVFLLLSPVWFLKITAMYYSIYMVGYFVYIFIRYYKQKLN